MARLTGGKHWGLIPIKEKLLIGLSENRVPAWIVVHPTDGGVGQGLFPVSNVLQLCITIIILSLSAV